MPYNVIGSADTIILKSNVIYYEIPKKTEENFYLLKKYRIFNTATATKNTKLIKKWIQTGYAVRNKITNLQNADLCEVVNL